MSREFPDFVDPCKAADGRRTFAGTMPLKRMQRLVPLLAAESGGAGSGEARFRARFARDRQGTVTVALQVEARLPLICQRSLRPYEEVIDRRSLVAIIEGPADQELLPESYEPVMVENGRLALQDLVEEELLLAIPQVPKNPAIDTIEETTENKDAAVSRRDQEEVYRPFSGLAGLMKE
jgi:uncharacterized protein